MLYHLVTACAYFPDYPIAAEAKPGILFICSHHKISVAKKVLFTVHPERKRNLKLSEWDRNRRSIIRLYGKDPVKISLEMLKTFKDALSEKGAEIAALQDEDPKDYKKLAREADLIISNANLDRRLLKGAGKLRSYLLENHGRKLVLFGNPRLSKRGIEEILKETNVKFPRSYNDVPVEKIHVPLVLKLPNSERGEGIFKVNEKKSIKRLFDPKAEYERIGKLSPNHFHIQEFIESPSEYYTHYRIFTIGNEPLLGSLHHSAFKKKDGVKRIEKKEYRPGVNVLMTPGSPIFLNSDDIRSNKAVGGDTIPLTRSKDAKKPTKEQKEILKDHGINPENPKIPRKLLELSRKVTKAMRVEGVQFSGQDWIQDKKGNFYLLEVNEAPGMDIFGDHFKGGKGEFRENIRIGFKHIAKRLLK